VRKTLVDPATVHSELRTEQEWLDRQQEGVPGETAIRQNRPARQASTPGSFCDSRWCRRRVRSGRGVG
jgi:hypothetical protein